MLLPNPNLEQYQDLIMSYNLLNSVFFGYIPTTVSKAKINCPYFDGLYHQFMVKLGMVHYWF